MSKIQWTEEVWNPLAGCTPVSPGCANCYAATMAKRLQAMGRAKYAGTVDTHGRWTGKINFDEKALALPLRVKKPTVWFVNSMSDLFHEAVPFEFVDRVFAVMALTPWHIYQVLTKRPERMAEYMNTTTRRHIIQRVMREDISLPANGKSYPRSPEPWPLPNVWLGVSVENQGVLNRRAWALLETPAAVRFLSCEPLLGRLDFDRGELMCRTWRRGATIGRYLDWVIVGGESGARARVCEGDWIRGIREQCKANGVACFVKQLGAAFWDGESGVIGKSVKIDRSGEELFRRLKDAKGGVMEEWPEEFRVREMPG